MGFSTAVGELASQPKPQPHPAGSAYDDDMRQAQQITQSEVWLKPSRSKQRYPSIYFGKRDPTVEEQSRLLKAKDLGAEQPLFKITSPSCEYYAIRLPLVKAGFKRISDVGAPLDGNLLWGKSLPVQDKADDDEKLARKMNMRPKHSLQKYNHFPGSHFTFGCKVGLANTLRRLSDSEQMRLSPKTWRLPQDAVEFQAEMSKPSSGTKRYIAKPARGSCGRGIQLFDGSEKDLVSTLIATATHHPSTWYVIQEYIDRPMLLDGRKFDFRLYVGVTSFDPLVCYLHRGGLVRFAAEEYSKLTPPEFNFALMAQQQQRMQSSRDATEHAKDPAAKAAARQAAALQYFAKMKVNAFAHLTNYSVGRHLEKPGVSTSRGAQSKIENGNVVSSLDGPSAAPDGFCDLRLKSSFADVISRLKQEGHDSERIQRDIDHLIVSTLLAGEQRIRETTRAWSAANPGISGRNFFEVFGFDVMLDAQGNPFLIEVNTLPSFESSSPLDYDVKSAVASDLLNLSMIELFERDPVLFTESGFLPPVSSITNPSKVASAAWCRPSPSRVGEGTTSVDSVDDTLARLQDEAQWCGGFRRLFPLPDNVDSYSHLITSPSKLFADVAGEVVRGRGCA